MLAADLADLADSDIKSEESFGTSSLNQPIIPKAVLRQLPFLADTLRTSGLSGNGEQAWSSSAQTPHAAAASGLPPQQPLHSSEDDDVSSFDNDSADDLAHGTAWEEYLASVAEQSALAERVRRQAAEPGGLFGSGAGADDEDGSKGSTWTSAKAIIQAFEAAADRGEVPRPDWEQINTDADRVMREHHKDILEESVHDTEYDQPHDSRDTALSPPHSPIQSPVSAGGAATTEGAGGFQAGESESKHPPKDGSSVPQQASESPLVPAGAKRLERMKGALADLDARMSLAATQHAKLIEDAKSRQHDAQVQVQ